MHYTHSGYWISIFGKNCAYYIQIFTVSKLAVYSNRTARTISQHRGAHRNNMKVIWRLVNNALNCCTICC